MTTEGHDVERLVVAVVRALNDMSVPHMLTGSLAVNFHAVPRGTKDADIVVQSEPFDPQRLVSRLAPSFKLDPQAAFETVTMTSRQVLEHSATGFLIELFGLTPDPHDQARFARRIPISLGGVPTAVASPEDVVVTKLRWARTGQRRKDLDDVRNVLAVQAGRLDMPYVQRWCGLHGTLEALQAALAEAER